MDCHSSPSLETRQGNYKEDLGSDHKDYRVCGCVTRQCGNKVHQSPFGAQCKWLN